MRLFKDMIDKFVLVLTVFAPFKPILALVTILVSIFAPVAPLIHAVLGLIILDTLSGIIAYYYKDGLEFKFFKWSTWHHISSHRLGDSVTKTFVYLAMIMMGFLIDTWVVHNHDLFVTKLLAASIGLREIKSLIENSEIILGGGLISTIKLFFKHGFKKGVEKMFDEENDKKDE